VGLEQLKGWERTAYEVLFDAAERGAPAPTADDLQAACGCNSVSTTVNLVQRLEQRGLIAVERYQRSRRITITATGKATAPVKNATPHWRSQPRPRDMPSIGLQIALQRKPDMLNQFLVAARREGLTVQDFIAELVWAGWQARAAAIQSASEAG
jgi:DNA-binding MarR family transcriptional regulator